MSDIRVNCCHCGQVFSAPDEWAGRSMACPQCGKQIAVPASDIRPEGAPILQVKHDRAITEGKRCPSCEATLPPEVVVCIQCGYDTRTGSRYLDNPQKSRMLQWVLWGFGLIILAGLAKAFLFQGRTGEVQGTVTPPVQQAFGASASAADTVANEIAVARPAVGVETALPPVVTDFSNKSPEDIAKLKAEYRATLNEQLGVTYPMYAPGDSVVLRRVNGLIHRGTLAALRSDVVVVVQNGQTNEVSLKELDRASRLKCDPAFRAQVVDFHVQKRVQEFADF